MLSSPLTWVEISSRAINRNLAQFRKLIGPKILLMPVVKSNAYGHGLFEIASLCERSRHVNRLCVISLDEALILRRRGIRKPIIILALYDFSLPKLKRAIQEKIIFPLYTLEQARQLNRAGERLKQKALVHLKIDIGTSRIGILPGELAGFAAAIKKMPFLECEGIFGHFASSEEDAARTAEQNAVFQNAQKVLASHGVVPRFAHAACSAASLMSRAARYSGIRLGLALYGLYPSPRARKKIALFPALSWRTKIIQVKTVPKASKISYGGDFVTKKTTRLAVIPVGYWDGYDRSLGNKAFVVIKGRRCPVRGRVCMNLTMVDVTDVPGVKAGDQATLIGREGQAEVTADELARLAGTINYEIVTRVNPLAPRLVV